MNRHSFPTATLALALLAALALGCSREPAREPPPPATPAPALPLAEPAAAPFVEEKKEAEGAPAQDSAAKQAPAESSAAPRPPASTAARPKPGAASKAKADRPAARQDSLDFGSDEARRDGSVLRNRLQQALQQATPDCPSARSRKQAICDLANQICQLVDRDPEIASVEAYCTDAKQRCSEAEQRTAERCK